MGGDRNAGLVIGFGLSLARAPGQILSIAQSAGSSRVRIMQVQARAAIAQLKSGDSRVLNLLAAARCAGWAKRDGASMLFLPECFGFLGQDSDQTISRADPPIFVPTDADCDLDTDFRNMPNFSLLLASTVFSHADGLNQVTYEDDDSRGRYDEEEVSILDGLQTIARESGLWISGGGMHESGAPNDPSSGRPRVYNSHVILDDKGRIKCVYRKSHMFDVSIPNKVNLKESATTAPGTDLVVCDSPVGRLGLSTCYDLRFPEMYVKLVQNGAEVLLVPSAFTVPTGKAHWHTLLTARAIESQCYVLAAAQVGVHNEKRKSYGHALAIDPWGDLVADAGGYDGLGTTGIEGIEGSPVETPSIILCDIERGKLESVRKRMPIQRHREAASMENTVIS